MTGRAFVTTIVLLSAGTPAAGQGVAFPPADVFMFEQAAPSRGEMAGVFMGRSIQVLGVEPLDAAEPVTDAPYSADATTEMIQPLADGNRIERRSTAKIARDSRGRVRREQQLVAIGPFAADGGSQVVIITDPVAGTHYSLDRERKVAVRMPLPTVRRFESGTAAVAAGVGVGGGAAVASAVRVAHAAEPKTESLGTMTVDGVLAEGTRTTISIEQGAIGNVAPIEVVSERWYSPELKTVVMSRRSDPRFGETIYRLENIVRAEPPAELFRVPSDYKLETRSPRVNTFRVEPARPR